MTHKLIDIVEREHIKRRPPEFQVGDTVDVHTRIIEGEKERVQVFNGVVIARKAGGVNAMFTVRRIVANEGVERVFAPCGQSRSEAPREGPPRETLLPSRPCRQGSPSPREAQAIRKVARTIRWISETNR